MAYGLRGSRPNKDGVLSSSRVFVQRMPSFQVDLFLLPETIQLESCKLQPFIPYHEPKSPPEVDFSHIRARKFRFTPATSSLRSLPTRNCLPFISTLEGLKTKEHGAFLDPQSNDYAHLRLQHDTIMKPNDIQVLKNRLSESIPIKDDVKPTPVPETKKKAPPTSFVDSDYERAESQNMHREISEKAALVLEHCDTKKFTNMTIRSQINTRVCQISNSRSQIRHIHSELLSIIRRASTEDIGPILAIITLKLLDQCELLVCTHPASAFSLAFVIVELMIDSQEFMFIFLQKLFDRCPYCIPMYIRIQKVYYSFTQYVGYLRKEHQESPQIQVLK